MSRHRNVRSINVNEEYEGYDDVYGHSVEDDYCVSPSEAAFMYDREGSKNKQKMGVFFQSVNDIAEENEGEIESKEANLSDVDKARLESCVDHIKQVLGAGIPRQDLVNIILLYDFNVEKALNFILGCPQYKHITEKKDDISYKKSFTIPKLNAKTPTDFKRTPLTSDSSSFSSLNELSRSHLLSVSTSPDTVKISLKNRSPFADVNRLTNDFRKVTVATDRDNNALENCHVDLTKALRGVVVAPRLRDPIDDVETFTPTFIDCEVVLPKQQPNPSDAPRKSSRSVENKRASAFGKVLCLRYRRPVPFVPHKSDCIGIPRFLFNCPSPDDIRISSLHNHLKRQK